MMHHKDIMGFTQPLKNIHHQNISLLIKSSNNTKGHKFKKSSMRSPPTNTITTCNARHHHIQAIRAYHNITNKTPPIGHTTKQIYKDLTLSNKNITMNKKNVAHKIKLFFKSTLTKTQVKEYTNNLINNYKTLPKKIPDHVRSVFIRAIYNALPLRGRTRHYANGPTECLFCGNDKETMQHLLFDCVTVNQCKKDMAEDHHIRDLPKMSTPAILLMKDKRSYVNPQHLNPTVTTIPHLFLFVVAIWRARNAILHNTRDARNEKDKTKVITNIHESLCHEYGNRPRWQMTRSRPSSAEDTDTEESADEDLNSEDNDTDTDTDSDAKTDSDAET
jgi:hypothetical protein